MNMYDDLSAWSEIGTERGEKIIENDLLHFPHELEFAVDELDDISSIYHGATISLLSSHIELCNVESGDIKIESGHIKGKFGGAWSQSSLDEDIKNLLGWYISEPRCVVTEAQPTYAYVPFHGSTILPNNIFAPEDDDRLASHLDLLLLGNDVIELKKLADVFQNPKSIKHGIMSDSYLNYINNLCNLDEFEVSTLALRVFGLGKLNDQLELTLVGKEDDPLQIKTTGHVRFDLVNSVIGRLFGLRFINSCDRDVFVPVGCMEEVSFKRLK